MYIDSILIIQNIYKVYFNMNKIRYLKLKKHNILENRRNIYNYEKFKY